VSFNQNVTVTDICSSLSLPDLELSWGAVTDVGKIRKLNEDDMLLAPGVFVVADGMGGHAAGEIASRLTIETFADIVTGGALDVSAIAGVISNANERVRDYSGSNGHQGMGCTVVGALLVDNAGENSLVVFNVGDARCYVLADDELVQLTHDHSLVQEMVDQGEIPASSARTHPQRNVVTRAVGIEPSVSADFVVAPRTSLRMLLCSDGVHGELADERLAALLRVAGRPDTIARSIIDAVLEGRASDNATAMVIDVVRSARVEPLALDENLGVTGPRPGLAAPFVSSIAPDAGATDAREVEHEPFESELDLASAWNDEIAAPPPADAGDGPTVLQRNARPATNIVIDSVPAWP
jgi:serine/threonine protein phosphatase PrpC